MNVSVSKSESSCSEVLTRAALGRHRLASEGVALSVPDDVSRNESFSRISEGIGYDLLRCPGCHSWNSIFKL